MPQSKATKKFERKHLKDVLSRRKEVNKIKQRKQVNDKRKARKAKDRAREDGDQEGDDAASGEEYKDMNVDEFFQSGFEVPDKGGEKSIGKKRKRAAAAKSGEGGGDDGVKGASTDSEDSVEAFPVGPDSASEEEDEDGQIDHAQQLRALKEKDPEFYKYMQEEDPELLEFENGNFEDIDALSEGEEDEEKPRKKRKQNGDDASQDEDSSLEVTKSVLTKWETSLTESKSLRVLREVTLAFKAAAYINDESGKSYKYRVANPDVYHGLLMLALEHTATVLSHHLPAKEHANGKISFSTETKKFKTLAPLIKSHISSVDHLLESLSDASTLRLTLTSILPLLPYVLSFKPIVRNLVKSSVTIWSATTGNEASRVAAFLILRKLVVIGDAGIRDSVLKNVYQGLIRGARNTTPHTLAGVNLMKNSAAELWGLDATLGYTTGFTFIRQLAMHLRSSITNPTADSYKTIYNWQYVHSLDFWSRVLSEHCASLKEAETGKESPLRPLIYPTVQVTVGAMRLIPTSAYFPLRFQLIRSLLRLSRATTTYIPLASAIYEVMQSNEMRKPPKKATLRPLDFNTTIRAPKQYLKTRVYQDGLGEQASELLSEFFVLWCKNIAFPELSLPAIVLIKRWLKDAASDRNGNRNHKINTAFRLVLQKLDSNSRFIEERRAKIDFAPNNRTALETFLKDCDWEKTPLGAYVVGQRVMRAQRDRALQQGRRAQDDAARSKDPDAGSGDDAHHGGGVMSDDDSSPSPPRDDSTRKPSSRRDPK